MLSQYFKLFAKLSLPISDSCCVNIGNELSAKIKFVVSEVDYLIYNRSYTEGNNSIFNLGIRVPILPILKHKLQLYTENYILQTSTITKKFN